MEGAEEAVAFCGGCDGRSVRLGFTRTEVFPEAPPLPPVRGAVAGGSFARIREMPWGEYVTGFESILFIIFPVGDFYLLI